MKAKSLKTFPNLDVQPDPYNFKMAKIYFLKICVPLTSKFTCYESIYPNQSKCKLIWILWIISAANLLVYYRCPKRNANDIIHFFLILKIQSLKHKTLCDKLPLKIIATYLERFSDTTIFRYYITASPREFVQSTVECNKISVSVQCTNAWDVRTLGNINKMLSKISCNKH